MKKIYYAPVAKVHKLCLCHMLAQSLGKSEDEADSSYSPTEGSTSGGQNDTKAQGLWDNEW